MNESSPRELIASYLLEITDAKGVVTWSDFIATNKKVIAETCDVNTQPAHIKGVWKSSFISVAQGMNITIKKSRDNWHLVEKLIKNRRAASPREESVSSLSTSSSTSSSSNSPNKNSKLSENDLEMVKKSYDSLNNFWTLSTGKVVEETMKQLALKSTYEHPVHSLIMDPSDPIWKEYFTAEELVEMSTFNSKELPKLPMDIEAYLDEYDNVTTSGDIYTKALNLPVDMATEKDKSWLQSTILSTAKLLENCMLPPLYFSEADIHHRIWNSTYTAFDGCQIKAKIGEKSGAASAARQNVNRALATTEKRSNRMMGHRIDVIYKYEDYELGCVEIGKDSATKTDNKYMDDGMIKLPKCLKDMLCILVDEHPEKVNDLATYGLIIMGMYVELVILDNPAGSISRLNKTSRYKFPSSVEFFAAEMPVVMEIIWIIKESMLNTVKLLSKKKRKAVCIDHNLKSPKLPSCFTAERVKKGRN